MPPENDSSTRVAQAMMNQVLTSWLLTTLPRSSASSNRFWEGSSVLSSRSASSDMRYPLLARRKFEKHVLDVAGERAHHGGDHQSQQEEADQDRQRQTDEEHLHLRHQTRQYAEAEIEDQSEHQERRRQLDADLERRRDHIGDVLDNVAREGNLTRREDHIAVDERHAHQVVQIAGEYH